MNTPEYQALPRAKVTGLPEGMTFFSYVQSQMQNIPSGWCIVDIHIDHYKLYADWYGLDAGRQLLAKIGGLLLRAVRDANVCAGYLGQEEFCLVMPFHMDLICSLHTHMTQVISSVSPIDGFCPYFGVAPIVDADTEILEFFNDAALTADDIRGDYRQRIRVYDAEQHRKNEQEYKILLHFQNAIDNDEITFDLQPQVRASNGKIVGAESLARWRPANAPECPPSVFVPILEKYGLVTQLDTYIWESVCRWMRTELDAGRQMVPVSVNVSQIDIASMDVAAHLQSLMQKYSLDESLLKVEITESACANDSGIVRDAIAALRDRGFTVLMDDFGSGYSSLNMLRSVNVDVIKLDAQFLRINEEDRRKGISILESIVNMAKTLSTPIIVEGAEREEQVVFLKELGCRYVQGYYFYRPMPPAQFESFLTDESRLDLAGITFKANQQLQIREFLDENIYSDSMLNNILGPVVFYNQNGEDVDITRFNEQFYELVGIESDAFRHRQVHIQEYIYPADRALFYRLLAQAEDHCAIGSRGTVRTYRPNGTLVWLALKIYFIGEDAQGKKFYASAQDETELQIINSDMPGAYYRCNLDHSYEFLYISRGFEKLTGFTELELRVLFNNCFINLVHPDDRKLLIEQSDALAEGKIEQLRPYRIRNKEREYIYVADQSQLTDRFGAVCWQSMLINVNEEMHLRNQMDVLSRHLTSTLLFLRDSAEGLRYEICTYNLADTLGLDAAAFESMLNSGDFCHMIEGCRDIPHAEYTRLFLDRIIQSRETIVIHVPDGRTVRLEAHADVVPESDSGVRYIVGLRLAADE